MLIPHRIRAITLDLDDTLWPIWPTIERAENLLQQWLAIHAPRAAALNASGHVMREIRAEMNTRRPDLAHDVGALRLEAIRALMDRAQEPAGLAEPAFEVFLAGRHEVQFFPDVLPALGFLAARYPLFSLTNGNADLARVGLAPYFVGGVSARDLGIGKPDPRIFLAAAQALGVQPQEVLHVGDDTVLDILGAQGVGMQTAWANRKEALWPHEGQAPHLEFANFSELCDALR